MFNVCPACQDFRSLCLQVAKKVCVGAALLLAAGCGTQDSAPVPTRMVLPSLTPSHTPTYTPSVTPTASDTPTITPTPTATPTITPTPSATFTPTETPTPSATYTPAPPRVVVQSEVGGYVRTGPGVEYEIAGKVTVGQAFDVLAYAADSAGDVWYLIDLPPGVPVWISQIVAEPAAGVDPARIALAATIPPSPTITATPTISPTPTLPPGADALTNADSGVNMRSGPGLTFDILYTISASTPLTLIGRNADGTWFEVRTLDGAQGWMLGELLDIRRESPGGLAITWIPTATPPLPTLAPPAAPSMLPPLSPGVIANVQAIYQRGLALGNDPNVFILLGDSVTVLPDFFMSFASGNYALGAYTHLQGVIDAYNRTNSFAAERLTVMTGLTYGQLLDPLFMNPAVCAGAIHTLDCEYQHRKPGMVIIYMGMNDSCRNPRDYYVGTFHQTLQYLIDHGVIPILTTYMNLEGSVCGEPAPDYAQVIYDMAAQYQVPLIDFRSVAQMLPNGGTGDDGVHLTFRDDHLIAFMGDEYIYGNTLRELLTLQMLYDVRRAVGL